MHILCQEHYGTPYPPAQSLTLLPGASATSERATGPEDHAAPSPLAVIAVPGCTALATSTNSNHLPSHIAIEKHLGLDKKNCRLTPSTNLSVVRQQSADLAWPLPKYVSHAASNWRAPAFQFPCTPFLICVSLWYFEASLRRMPIPRIARAPLTSKEPEACPYCGSHHLTRRGTRKKKLEIVQLWRCAACKRVFTPGPAALRNRTYPVRMILSSLTDYDTGYTLEETAARLKKRTRRNVSPSTIAAWLEQYKQHCNYRRLRSRRASHASLRIRPSAR